MILSFSFQIEIVLLAITIGFAMGFFYDIIRIFRNIVFHGNILIHIEDIIYWIFMSIAIFLIILYVNNGEIRAFFVIGIILGMLFYFFTISKLFIKVSNKILFIIKRIIKFIIECILTPFKIVLNILRTILRPIFKVFYKNFKKTGLNIKKVLQNNKKCVNIYSKGIYAKNKISSVFNRKRIDKKEGGLNEK